MPRLANLAITGLDLTRTTVTASPIHNWHRAALTQLAVTAMTGHNRPHPDKTRLTSPRLTSPDRTRQNSPCQNLHRLDCLTLPNLTSHNRDMTRKALTALPNLALTSLNKP